jgi:hypothetical protein
MDEPTTRRSRARRASATLRGEYAAPALNQFGKHELLAQRMAAGVRFPR